MTALPRFLVAGAMSIINLALTIAFFYILYRIFGPIVRDYQRRHRKPKKRPPSYYSDRR